MHRVRPFGWWRLAVQALFGTDSVVSASSSSFSADDYTISANSSATATFAPIARNATGQPLSGKTVVFSKEIITISAANSVVTASPATIASDGVEKSYVTVTLKDASNRAIPDYPASGIVIAVSGSGNTITQPTGSTSQGGTISTGYFVSSGAGTKTVSVTAGGVAITDTASAEVSGSPPAAGFDNEPSGGTWAVVGDWNNESAMDAEGFYADGNPSLWGEKSRVTSGYEGTPTLGGSAVIQTYYAGGVDGGHDGGRTQLDLPSGAVRCFMGLEVQHRSDYPVSNQSNKQFFVMINGGVDRLFVDFDDLFSLTNWAVSYSSGFGEPGDARDISTTPYVLGNWTKVEWLVDKSGGAGAGVMRLWIGGVLVLERTDLTYPAGSLSFVYDDGENNGNHTALHPSGQRKIGFDAGAETDAYRFTSRIRVLAATT